MFSYAAKRTARSGFIFIALFLSVTLAVTQFCGVLHGADSVGAAMLKKAMKTIDVDILSSAENRVLTEFAFGEMERLIRDIKNVRRVDHLVRCEMDLNTTSGDESMPFTVVAIDSNSSLLTGIRGVERLEDGKIYIELSSTNATSFQIGERVSLKMSTYTPFSPFLSFELRFLELTVGEMVQLDERLFSITTGFYGPLLRSTLLGVEAIRLPPHRLIIITEDTLRQFLESVYAEMRRPAKAMTAELIISLDRDALVNPWDIGGAKKATSLLYERINSIGASHMYVPVNYLEQLLDFVETNSSALKTSTLLVAMPVFFTAWYLSLTVSDITLGLRRREIGLLLTRGLTHRQVFHLFLLEAIIVSLFAGAFGVSMGAILVLSIVPEIGVQQGLSSLSPTNVYMAFAFSGSLALLAIYKPAKEASRMSLVDALRESHTGDEPKSSSWQEPLLAIFLGGYKVATLIVGFDVESFRPATENIILVLLYSTWWGVDYMLTYIAPMLFFWGCTKLFIQHSTGYHDLVRRVTAKLWGDRAFYSTLSFHGNVGRLVACAFMVALIFGHSVSMIGSLASTDDYLERVVKMTVGADASVWLFSGRNAAGLADRISTLQGVSGATVETWFEAQSSLGTIPIRAIDPLKWGNITYIERGWLEGADCFEKMKTSETAAIMEKGAATLIGVKLNGTMLIKLGTKVHSFKIVGLFGREPSAGWTIQNPTLYVPNPFLSKVDQEDIKQVRILVEFKGSSAVSGFVEAVKALDENIENVDIAEAHLERASSNIFLVGPRRVEEIGVYLAAVLSSVGVALIVSTVLRSRWKELCIMAVRGFSWKQLVSNLLIENTSMLVFAILLGSAVGYVFLLGEIRQFNWVVSGALERRLLFPPAALLSLTAIVGLLLGSTIIPIVVVVRGLFNRSMWRVEE